VTYILLLFLLLPQSQATTFGSAVRYEWRAPAWEGYYIPSERVGVVRVGGTYINVDLTGVTSKCRATLVS
jgi:hypothetical protein